MNDPWIHRSQNMKCGSCMWFLEKMKAPPADNLAAIPMSIGRCRRHAPTMNGYPVVFVTDWCGDHKLNEEKV